MSLLASSFEIPYHGYAYGYPHKLAYRTIQPSLSLTDLWEQEDKDALFLYIHLPFCEMRCGFCNLFTTANPNEGFVAEYLKALIRQMRVVSEVIGSNARFSRLALGGGTPTFLSATELNELLAAVKNYFPGTAAASCSVEMSPGTVSEEKLKLLLKLGMTRASIGIQSFIGSETRQLGRPQDIKEVHKALRLIRDSSVPVLNLDLIYGIEGQTLETWLESLSAALYYRPEEIYLYPLYVRPLTGLDRIGREPSDQRLSFYRQARTFLLNNGYRQVSMRLFRAESYLSQSGPEYCCQEDGMLGLGAGARSYTKHVHYSTEYAVGRAGIRDIIAHFNQSSDNDFRQVSYGCRLNDEEQRRRYVIKSILRSEGVNFDSYFKFYNSQVLDDFSQLRYIETFKLGTISTSHLVLNHKGLELSDVLGPWLYSSHTKQLIEEYELK